MDLVKLRTPTGNLEEIIDLSVSADLAKKLGINLAAHFAEIE
jgi:hypothetical protein